MSRHFDTELKELKNGLVAMAGQVEEMIDLAVATMVKRSDTLAEHLRDLDRHVDEQEIALDQA